MVSSVQSNLHATYLIGLFKPHIYSLFGKWLSEIYNGIHCGRISGTTSNITTPTSTYLKVHRTYRRNGQSNGRVHFLCNLLLLWNLLGIPCGTRHKFQYCCCHAAQITTIWLDAQCFVIVTYIGRIQATLPMQSICVLTHNMFDYSYKHCYLIDAQKKNIPCSTSFTIDICEGVGIACTVVVLLWNTVRCTPETHFPYLGLLSLGA